ncbi:MAG: TadE/TadG family type IV pilus assembly protein [Gammaproteobacteria bacterium]
MILAKIRALWNDRSGVAAIEFAILAPLMILTFVGVVEVSHALTVSRKVTAATYNVANLLSRYEEVADSDIQDIFTVAESNMVPYDTSNLAVRLTLVHIDEDGTTVVGWSDAKNMDPLDQDAAFVLPDGIGEPGGSVVFAETSYDHETITRPGDLIFGGSTTLSDAAYVRPRLTPRVVRISGDGGGGGDGGE